LYTNSLDKFKTSATLTEQVLSFRRRFSNVIVIFLEFLEY